jgi:hypothetical protein
VAETICGYDSLSAKLCWLEPAIRSSITANRASAKDNAGIPVHAGSFGRPNMVSSTLTR